MKGRTILSITKTYTIAKKMTKKELLKSLEPFDDDSVVVCMDCRDDAVDEFVLFPLRGSQFFDGNDIK